MEVWLMHGVRRLASGRNVLLFDERDGAFYSLNATAVMVMDRLLGGDSADQAAVELASRYQIGAEQARSDVTALIEQLAVNHLIGQSP